MVTENARPTDDALDVLASASTAAFAIDRNDRIVYWNEGAASLLGWTAAEMLGTFCFESLEGRDPFGNLYCSAQCPILQAAANGEVSEPFVMHVRSKGKDVENVRVLTIPLPEPGPAYSCIMHLVDSGGGETDELVRRLKAAASRHRASPLRAAQAMTVNPLTPREREIVLLLSNGYAALNISARLNLSHATVRNHIQNLLRKLSVHSQVEAIALAFRSGWI